MRISPFDPRPSGWGSKPVTMQNVKRWLFNLATLLSLMLCIASVAVWIRSQFRSDYLSYCNDADGDGTPASLTDESVNRRRPSWSTGRWNDYWMLSTDRHGVMLFNERIDVTGALEGQLASDGWQHGSDPADDLAVVMRLCPMFSKHGSYSPPNVSGRMELDAPHWLLTLTFGILPVIALIRIRRKKFQLARGRCRRCEYDLRATPERCPECGTIPHAENPI